MSRAATDYSVGDVLGYGWVVASTMRVRVEAGGQDKSHTYAICPRCFQPWAIQASAPPKKCGACAKRPYASQPHDDPERWRSLVTEASEAFTMDFRYGEEMMLFRGMLELGKSLQPVANQV